MESMFAFLRDVMTGWEPFGQGLFLLIVIGGFFSLIAKMVYYATVAVRGWPPAHVSKDDDED